MGLDGVWSEIRCPLQDRRGWVGHPDGPTATEEHVPILAGVRVSRSLFQEESGSSLGLYISREYLSCPLSVRRGDFCPFPRRTCKRFLLGTGYSGAFLRVAVTGGLFTSVSGCSTVRCG